MKTALLLAVLAVLAVALVGAGTWAYFTDVETSADNVFNGGTLDLNVDGENDPDVGTYFEADCLKPGDVGTTEIILSNVGCADGIADIKLFNVASDENGLAEPELELGDAGPGGELCDHLWLTLTAYGGDGAYLHIEDWLGALADIEFDIGPLDAGSAIPLVIGWEVPEGTGNVVQTDTCRFDIEFSLTQADRPPQPVIVVPQDGGWVSGATAVRAIEERLRDDIVSTLFECSADGDGWAVIGEDLDGSDVRDDDPGETSGDGWSCLWDTSLLAEGFYHLRATMTDTEGRTGSDQVMVYVDPTPPLPQFVTPLHEDVVSGVVPLELTTDDEDAASAVWAYFPFDMESPYKKDLTETKSGQYGPVCAPKASCYSLQWLDKKYDDDLVPDKYEYPCRLTSVLIGKYGFCKGKGNQGTTSTEATNGLRGYVADHGGNFTVKQVDTKPSQGWFTYYKTELPEEDIYVSVRIRERGKYSYHALTGWMFDQEAKIKENGKEYFNVGFLDPASGRFSGHKKGYEIYMNEDGELIQRGTYWQRYDLVKSFIVVSPEHTHDQLVGEVDDGDVNKKEPVTVDDQWEDGFNGEWDTTTVEDGSYILLGSIKDDAGNEAQETILVFVDQTPDPPQPPPEPGQEWAWTFGGEDQDHAYAVEPTLDGGFIIAGSTYSFGAGGHDVLLIKTGPMGEVEWASLFGGEDSDFGYAVTPTLDGGYIVAGETYSFGDGASDAYLVRTDPMGVELWSRTFGGEDYDAAYAVRETDDGGYIIAGETYSFGEMDVYLVRTDPMGNEMWSSVLGGEGHDVAYALEATSDGGYIVAGGTSSGGLGDEDVLLLKTDALGNEEWVRAFGGEEFDAAYSVMETVDGGFVAVGETCSFGAGAGDMYAVRTDAGGVEVWSQTYGGAEYDHANAVAPAAGGYVIAGGTHSFGDGKDDVYLVWADEMGNEMWSEAVGGEGHDRAYALAECFDGGLVVAGCSDSYGADLCDAYWFKLLPGY